MKTLLLPPSHKNQRMHLEFFSLLSNWTSSPVIFLVLSLLTTHPESHRIFHIIPVDPNENYIKHILIPVPNLLKKKKLFKGKSSRFRQICNLQQNFSDNLESILIISLSNYFLYNIQLLQLLFQLFLSIASLTNSK